MIIAGFALLAFTVWIYFEKTYLPKFPGFPGDIPLIENFDAVETFEYALNEYQIKKDKYDEYLKKNKYVGRIYSIVTIIPYPSFMFIRLFRRLFIKKNQKKRIKAKRK